MATTVANVRTFWGDLAQALLIDRTTPWGNPFRMTYVGDGTSRRMVSDSVERARVIRDHLIWWYSPEQRELRRRARRELTGKTLLCHCAPAPCHGDTIANYLDAVVPFYEHGAPWSLWFLSYAGDEGWRGGVFVMAPSFLDACQLSAAAGVSPGGQVLGREFDTDLIDAAAATGDEHALGLQSAPRMRLLDKQQLLFIGMSMGPVTKH